jgi:KDO2-lipid IV(A) lauroyltransferase
MKAWKRFRRRVRYTFLYVVFRILIFLARFIPRNAWLSLFGFLGRLSYHLAAKSRQTAVANLTLAYGKEMDARSIRGLAKSVFTMIGKNGADVIWLHRKISWEDFDNVRQVIGEEYLDQAYRKGKGVIFLTAHLGAFELCATEMALRGYKPLIIGTPMKDERLTKLLWEQRSKLGASAIERGKETVRLIKTLKAGGTVAILIDQDTRVKSVFVDFFGKPCATPIGAAVLALKTGAAVVPVFLHLSKNDKQIVTCYPEVELIQTGDEAQDIRANTQKFTSIIESEIREHPEQWLWIHERWKTQPGQELT